MMRYMTPSRSMEVGETPLYQSGSPRHEKEGKKDKMDSAYRKPQSPSHMRPRPVISQSVNGRLNLPLHCLPVGPFSVTLKPFDD